MKYVYSVAGICLVLFGTHLFAFSKGCEAGRNQIKSELYETTQAQVATVVQASQKILDFQRIIGNNNDECFNRVWSDEIINVTNPQLR